MSRQGMSWMGLLCHSIMRTNTLSFFITNWAKKRIIHIVMHNSDSYSCNYSYLHYLLTHIHMRCHVFPVSSRAYYMRLTLPVKVLLSVGNYLLTCLHRSKLSGRFCPKTQWRCRWIVLFLLKNIFCPSLETLNVFSQNVVRECFPPDKCDHGCRITPINAFQLDMVTCSGLYERNHFVRF